MRETPRNAGMRTTRPDHERFWTRGRVGLVVLTAVVTIGVTFLYFMAGVSSAAR